MKIVGALGVDTFVDDEVLPVFLMDQGMAAVGTFQYHWFTGMGAGLKILPTDFTLEFTAAAVVVIDVLMRGTADRTDRIFRNGFSISTLNRADNLVITPFIISKQELPVLLFKNFNNRKFIHLKFLILGRMGVVKRPLFQGDVSADKVQ